MDKKKADASTVDKSEKRIIQNLGDKIRDCFHCGFFNKMKISQVNENEEENSGTGIWHGFRSQGSAAGASFHGILAPSGLTVFKKENNTGNDVQEKNGIEPDFKNGYKNA